MFTAASNEEVSVELLYGTTNVDGWMTAAFPESFNIIPIILGYFLAGAVKLTDEFQYYNLGKCPQVQLENLKFSSLRLALWWRHQTVGFIIVMNIFGCAVVSAAVGLLNWVGLGESLSYGIIAALILASVLRLMSAGHNTSDERVTPLVPLGPR